jgi:hypothetical protein
LRHRHLAQPRHQARRRGRVGDAHLAQCDHVGAERGVMRHALRAERHGALALVGGHGRL